MYMHMRAIYKGHSQGLLSQWAFQYWRNRSFNSVAKLSSLRNESPKYAKAALPRVIIMSLAAAPVHYLFWHLSKQIGEECAQNDGYMFAEAKGACIEQYP